MTIPDREEFVRCRSLGHSWDDYNPPKLRPLHGFILAFRCTRCTTERHDAIDRRSGELTGRRYLYPDGYKTTRDERPSAEELRVRIADIRERRKRRRARKAAS